MAAAITEYQVTMEDIITEFVQRVLYEAITDSYLNDNSLIEIFSKHKAKLYRNNGILKLAKIYEKIGYYPNPPGFEDLEPTIEFDGYFERLKIVLERQSARINTYEDNVNDWDRLKEPDQEVSRDQNDEISSNVPNKHDCAKEGQRLKTELDDVKKNCEKDKEKLKENLKTIQDDIKTQQEKCSTVNKKNKECNKEKDKIEGNVATKQAEVTSEEKRNRNLERAIEECLKKNEEIKGNTLEAKSVISKEQEGCKKRQARMDEKKDRPAKCLKVFALLSMSQELEKCLRNKANIQDRRKPLRELISIASSTGKITAHQKDLLEEFSAIRNSVVHDSLEKPPSTWSELLNVGNSLLQEGLLTRVMEDCILST